MVGVAMVAAAMVVVDMVPLEAMAAVVVTVAAVMAAMKAMVAAAPAMVAAEGTALPALQQTATTVGARTSARAVRFSKRR